MVWIPGGTFPMGTGKHYPEAAPVHRFNVDASGSIASLGRPGNAQHEGGSNSGQETTMIILRWISGVAMLAASISASHAGPCSANIDAMQARVDAKLEAIAASGRFAPQGVSAGMSDQPTPHSIAAAEVRLGEIKRQSVRTIRRAMARARAADAAGKERGCEKELAVVQRVLGP
jgi:hypothetical protein